MQPRGRRAKKRREAERLRDVAPEVTLDMGFALMAFAYELGQAADRARA